MKTIAVINQGGGRCKSSLTREIAVRLAKQGLRIAVIDACIATTSTIKWSLNNTPTTKLISVFGASEKLNKRDFDICIYDTGAGALSFMPELAQSLADSCDLGLIPVQPTALNNGFADTMTVLAKVQMENSKICPVSVKVEHLKDKQAFEVQARQHTGITLFNSYMPFYEPLEGIHERGEIVADVFFNKQLESLCAEITDFLGLKVQVLAHA